MHQEELSRGAFTGGRISRKELARALDVCEDTIDNSARRFNVRYISLFNTRYFDLAEFRAAVAASIRRHDSTPRRGRPPKVAA
jgi:hypothetical protein